MKVLQVVKTSDGARWAARQSRVLVENGVTVHAVVPDASGEAIPYWRASGATLHIADFSLPVSRPHQWRQHAARIRSLVKKINPDLIHSHFVTTTMMLRLALGEKSNIPRLFQVPGPLHLEHKLFRRAEIALSDKNDWWIASSRYIRSHYERSGIPQERIFLSYYGNEFKEIVQNTAIDVRKQFQIPPANKLIGNVNYMYPPKYYLGQTKGLKRHEDVIDAIGIINRRRSDVTGVLVGGQWGGGQKYEARLQKRAQAVAPQHIHFTGRVAPQESAAWWSAFDCAVHVPASENCGGVLEPLMYRAPVIASRIGGLPEVVMDGLTGWLVPVSSPRIIARTVETVLNSPEEGARRAELGRQLVSHMFDVERTAREILAIYHYVLGLSREFPPMFDSRAYVETLRS